MYTRIRFLFVISSAIVATSILLLSCAAEETPAEVESEEEAPPYDRPIYDGTWTFTYQPPADAAAIESVTVPGSFNNWSTSADPMEQQMDGTWQLTVEIPPGRHEYKFYINDQWPQDMEHSEQWGRAEHDYRVDPLADGYTADGHGGQNAVLDIDPDSEVAEGSGFSHDPERAEFVSRAADLVSIRFRTLEEVVERADLVDGEGGEHEMSLQLSYPGRDVWRVALRDLPQSYEFVLETADGEERHGPFEAPSALFEAVEWVRDAVGYQIFPERFANSNSDATLDERGRAALETDSYNFKDREHWYWDGPPEFTEGWDGAVTDRHCCHQYFGGDLDGIRERLDYLDELGVTLLYMTPIFESGSAHGYDAHDFRTVAPNFGDEETLRSLLDEAGERGMRVMWDFVPNHVGTGHWAFQDAVAGGAGSDYADWFFFHVEPDAVEVGMPDNVHYDSWWGLGNLPELDTSNPEVLDHLLDVTRYWSEFGFDGIRVDVPNEIRNRDEFFPLFREAAKSVSEEIYLVGEVWQRDPTWLEGDEFDSLMNYAIGQQVIEQFVSGSRSAESAAAEMGRLYGQYPEASVAMQFNIISSHDTARLATMVSGVGLGGRIDEPTLERIRMAATMLYALPGMPVTFQGDELGFLGDGEGPWERNRFPMQWGDGDRELSGYYARLAGIKSGAPALSSPLLRDVSFDDGLLSFARGEPGPGELRIVANRSDGTVTVELPGSAYRELVGERYHAADAGAETVRAELPARSVGLFERRE